MEGIIQKIVDASAEFLEADTENHQAGYIGRVRRSPSGRKRTESLSQATLEQLVRRELSGA